MPHGVGVCVIQLFISSHFVTYHISPLLIIPLPFFAPKSPHLCPFLPSVVRLPPLTGWNKASLSVDASEENDGYSSSEDPMNSDPEDEGGKKLVSLNLKSYTFSIRFPISLVFLSDVFTPHRLPLVTFDPLGSRKVHGGSGLREGGTSGAVCQERRRGPADQRRRGGTMVTILLSPVKRIQIQLYCMQT